MASEQEHPLHTESVLWARPAEHLSSVLAFLFQFDAGTEDDQTTIALLYDLGTEKLVDEVDHHRSIWTGPSVLIRHSIIGPWSVALRPELSWDEDGRQTGFSQFVQAMTTTLEYKISMPDSGILLRLEHRYDVPPDGKVDSSKAVRFRRESSALHGINIY